MIGHASREEPPVSSPARPVRPQPLRAGDGDIRDGVRAPAPPDALQRMIAASVVARQARDRVLARDELTGQAAPAAATAAPAAAAPAADWRTIVPDADPTSALSTTLGAKNVVELVYGTRKLPTPKKGTTPAAAAVPAPTAAEQAKIDAACTAVAEYRKTLPGPAHTQGITKSQGAKWAGTSWTRYTDKTKFAPPKATKKDPTPDDPRTEAQKAAYTSASEYTTWLSGVSAAAGSKVLPAATATAADKAAYQTWLQDRLFLDIAGMEGGTDSINVYDSQIVTWGGGLGGASGAVAGAMKAVADSTTQGGGKSVGVEVTKILADAGITFATNAAGAQEFVVLDTATKRKYRGNDALILLKSDLRLLMLFTSIARGELPGAVAPTPAAGTATPTAVSLKEAVRQTVFDTQKNYFLTKHHKGADSAQRAIDELGPTWPVASLMMVLHLQWWGVSKWAQYKATNGDMKAIIKRAMELYKTYVTTRNGATIAQRDLAKHLYDFGGQSSRDCWGAAQQIAETDLEKDAHYMETTAAVTAKPAVADKVDDKGKVVKKGSAEIVAKDATYRKLL